MECYIENMKFDFILTFDVGPQEFGTGEFEPFFQTKEVAVAYFKGVTINSKQHLVKVSICAHTSDLPGLPLWFMKDNGKLWADDLGTEQYLK